MGVATGAAPFLFMTNFHKLETMVRRQHPCERLWLIMLKQQEKKNGIYGVT